MDDLKILRGAGPRPVDPSAAARSAARAALLEHVSGPATVTRQAHRYQLPRLGVRLVAVGSLAVAIAAGVTVAQNIGGVGKDGKPRQVVPGLPAGSVANAAQTALYTAADHAQSQPFTAPRSDQWIYSEQRYKEIDKPTAGEVLTATTPLRTRVDRTWIRPNGRLEAYYSNGKLVTTPTGGQSVMPPTDYATVTALPRDPAALLAWAENTKIPVKGGGGSYAFIILGALLNDNPVLPPAERATIYRALARIPGVTLNKDRVDVAGHPALAVSYVGPGGWRNDEILLDPTTYAYRGTRQIVVKDYALPVPGGTATIRKGTIEVLETVIRTGIVDRPGQRP